jgi:hypothetical protein
VLPPITGFILLIAQLIKVTMQYVAPNPFVIIGTFHPKKEDQVTPQKKDDQLNLF